MKLPNWLKVVWWLAIVAALTYFLWARLPALLSGEAAVADVAVFGVWIALLLAPLFSEVTLLGITLKNEIEELKGAVTAQLTDIRTEVRSAVDVRTTLSQQFHMPAPVADAQLPQLEERVKAAVSRALSAHGLPDKLQVSTLTVDQDVSFLFSTRYNLELELRRIANARAVVTPARRGPLPTFQLVRALTESELLEPRLANAIKEVYSVCSPAIHGEEVSPAQVSFVRDVGPQLVAALRAIQ